MSDGKYNPAGFDDGDGRPIDPPSKWTDIAEMERQRDKAIETCRHANALIDTMKAELKEMERQRDEARAAYDKLFGECLDMKGI